MFKVCDILGCMCRCLFVVFGCVVCLSGFGLDFFETGLFYLRFLKSACWTVCALKSL